MSALFRIDQTTPGQGTLDRSRSDLIPGEAISLVVPSPVAGATYSWEILQKVGSTAALTSPTGSSTTIGPSGEVGVFCGFLVRCTETLNGVVTKSPKRIAAVPGAVTGLRPFMFGESANGRATFVDRHADESTDNEVQSDLDGVSGNNDQNWTGYASHLNKILTHLEASGVTPTVFAGVLAATTASDTPVVLLTRDVIVLDVELGAVLIDAVFNVAITTGTGNLHLQVVFDDTPLRDAVVTPPATNAKFQVSFAEYFETSTGEHTISLRWYVEDGGDVADCDFATLRITGVTEV